MRVLVFSQAAWNTTNNVGNTLSNLFNNWDDVDFFSFYTRKQYPSNNRVVEYYNRSVTDIIKSIFSLKSHYIRFPGKEINENIFGVEDEKERRIINSVHKRKSIILHLISELIWKSKIWIDKDFKRFINDVNPDILFSFTSNAYILSPLIDYLKKTTNCKIVLYIVDDVYNEYNRQEFFRRKYLLHDYIKVINQADKIYAITDYISERYKTLFHIDAQVLHKGCLLVPPPTFYNQTSIINLVYAGNLLYGRFDVLKRIILEIEKINEKKQLFKLHVYSNVSDYNDELLYYSNTDSVAFYGTVPYEEILKAQKEADYNLQIESFEPEMIDLVRGSFSTKIIDCLQSGKGIISIGPLEDYSINYMNNIQGTITIANIDSIRNGIESLLSINDNEYNLRINQIRSFIDSNCNGERISNSLKKDFKQLVEDKK